MPPSKAKQLGRFVQRHRREVGVSLREAAKQMGLDYTWLYRLEKGEIESPAPDKLVRVARVLKVDTEDLFALVGYMSPDQLPDFVPYLRAKFDLNEAAVRELSETFRRVLDEPVPKQRKKGGIRAKRSR